MAGDYDFEFLYKLSTACKDEYVQLVKNATPTQISSVLDFLGNIGLFIKKLPKAFTRRIATVIWSSYHYPEQFVEVMTIQRLVVQSALSQMFLKIVVGEIVKIIVGHGKGHESY